MKEKKNKTVSIIICILLFTILYIVFAFRILSPEFHLTPEWTVGTQEETPFLLRNDTLLPFKSGQTLGYFTSNGKIALSKSFSYKGSVSKNFFVTYNNDSTSFTVFNNDGSELCTINEAGFPYIQEDRIYVMLPGGNAFKAFDHNGKEIFSWESYAPITAFSSSKGGTVAGFADGRIIAFDKRGKITQNFIPGGSEINIIIGCDISDNGQYIACITGINKQRFILSKNEGDHSKIVFHEYLSEDSISQRLVKFSEDTVYYDCNNKLGILPLSTIKPYKIDLKGKAIQIEEGTDPDLTFVLSKEDAGKYTVTVIEPLDNIAAQFSYTADNSFIQVFEDCLYVGKDSKISCMRISKE